MEQIRYKQRICTDQNKINDFLRQTRIGVLGLNAGEYPYSVPLNYIWHEGKIYFHGMGSGKKTQLLEEEPAVSFTVFEEAGTVKDPVPCHADTAYMSVMLFGHAKKLTDYTEAAKALQLLVEKYMPGFYRNPISASTAEHYRSSHDNRAVAVYKITPEAITAKENTAEEASLF